MMITILDIVDSAVKVGLGALISGIVTYFTLSKKNADERRGDLISYKRLKLIELSENFQLAGELTNDISHWVNQEPSDQMSMILLNKDQALEAAKKVCNLVSSAVRLSALIGDRELTELMKAYWVNRNSLYKLLNRNDFSEDCNYNEIKRKVDEVRSKIFNQFSTSLKQIHA